jgi:hypothetical protein
MFCPQCKSEYRVGFTRCSDCQIDLVDHLLVEQPRRTPSGTVEAGFLGPEDKLVVIRTFQSGLDADLAKSVLEAAGIDSTITGDQGIRRHYLGLALTPGIKLLVRSEDAEDADKILNIA